MSELEKFINDLSDEDLQYLESTVFTENGIVSRKELDRIIEEETTSYNQKNAVQFSLKINLNSVYGVQIMNHFKFTDEWGSLGASTTLSGRILSKFGLIEAIEHYFNPERETRWEFPLLENIAVAADDESFYKNPETQMLRAAVISDTDSVTGDSIVSTGRFGEIEIEELERFADRIETNNGKEFFFFDKGLQVKNYINGEVKFDDVEFIYAHDVRKDVYEVELEDGSIIRVTEDHSLMTINSDGEPTIEKKPTELTENDYCLVM